MTSEEMMEFSIVWEGITNVPPEEIIERMSNETKHLPSFQLNKVHTLTMMWPHDDVVEVFLMSTISVKMHKKHSHFMSHRIYILIQIITNNFHA